MWRLALAAAVTLAACGPRAPLGSRTPGATATGAIDREPALAPDGSPAAAPGAATAVVDDYPRAADGGVVISRLPAPHRLRAAVSPSIATLDDARALVGRRDPRSPLAAALGWSSELTGRPAPAVTDGAALVAWAQGAGAWRAVPALVPGDLIVFDRAVGGARASLVAVALGRDERGVVEVLYLGNGVVRRGWFDPTRPAVKRDRARRVVNTSLRHNRDQPPRGTRFLAGELFAGVISTAPSR